MWDISPSTFHFPGLILWASFQAAYLCFSGCCGPLWAVKQLQLNFFQIFQLLPPARNTQLLSESFDPNSRALWCPLTCWELTHLYGWQRMLCLCSSALRCHLFLSNGFCPAQVDAWQMNKSAAQPNDQLRNETPISILAGILNLPELLSHSSTL